MKYRLGDICAITKGGTGIMKAIPGPYTMVTLGEADKTNNEFQFDTKAVIIPLVSSTGHGHASMKRVKYCEGKFALGNILIAVIPKDESFVLAKYLHIYLHWNKEELLVSQMKGMANVSLPMNKIADVLVIVPSIEKQKEIIDLEKKLIKRELELDKLFEDQLTQLENLNQAILNEAVQGKLVVQDSKDEPASELLKRIKVEKAKLGKKEKLLPPIKLEETPFEIPENWVWCRIDDILDFSKESLRRGPFGSSITKGMFIPKYNPNATKVYEQKNAIYKNHTLGGYYIDIEKYTNLKSFLTGFGDIIISCAGTIGEAYLLPKDAPVGVINQALLKIRLNENIILNAYFLVFFKAIIKAKVNTDAKGSAMKNLGSIKYLRENLLIPLPPHLEQKRIVVELDRQLAKAKQLKEHIITNQQATEQLLKALLHQAFEVTE